MTIHSWKFLSKLCITVVAFLPVSILASGMAVDPDRNLVYHSAASLDPAVIIQDVNDPSNPVQLSHITSTVHAKNISVDTTRDLLFVSLGDAGMQIVDVSDATAPQEVAYWSNKSWDVAVQDGIAYIARNDRYFDIVDVSDMNNIQLLERVTYFSFEGYYSTGIRTSTSEIDNNRLWIGGSTNDINVYEITSPGILNRIEVGINYGTSKNTKSIVFDGNTAVLTNGNLIIRDSVTGTANSRINRVSGAVIAAINGIAYTGSTQEFIMYDISDPSNIYELETVIRPTSGYPTGFGSMGEKLFIALSSNTGGAFQVFDVSQTIAPELIANVSAIVGGGNGGGITETVNLRPIANAGGDQAADSRKTVFLDGSNSYDPDGNIISFQWMQILGKTVTLSDANTATPTFKSPRIRRKKNGMRLVFQITVTDDRGATNYDLVNIFVYR